MAQTITGKVIGLNDKGIPFAYVKVYDSLGIKSIGIAETDVNGFYKIAINSFGYFQVKIAYIGYKPKSFMIKVNRDSTINFDMVHPCEYDKSINNSTCPVCHKKDSVISIENGMPRDTAGMKIPYCLGSINIEYCHPHWYCKRDNLKF